MRVPHPSNYLSAPYSSIRTRIKAPYANLPVDLAVVYSCENKNFVSYFLEEEDRRCLSF